MGMESPIINGKAEVKHAIAQNAKLCSWVSVGLYLVYTIKLGAQASFYGKM